MRLHAAQDVVEGLDGLNDEGTLVEHDAFGALSHGGVGNFRARWDAGAGEAFEDLRGPDDGDVRGFADPEYFFLHFGEALVAAFHGEVAAGDHDADDTHRHGGEDEGGKILKGVPRFDLENDAERFPFELAKMTEELLYVVLGAHEGITDEVGVFDDELEILEVFGSEGGQIDLRLGEVDALRLAQILSFGARLSDFDTNAGLVDGADDAADFSVVEPDGLAGLCVPEEFGQGDSDACGRSGVTEPVARCGLARAIGAGEDECLSGLEEEFLRRRGKHADAGGRLFGGSAIRLHRDDTELHAGDEVGGLL